MSQDVCIVFKYNGGEFEFDIRDAEMAENYQKAAEELEKEQQTIPKDGPLSTMIRKNCEMLRNFFDNLLGNGAGVAICGERFNISNHYDAYGAFLDFVNAQSADMTRARNTFTKYSNRGKNRQERRHKNKFNGKLH